MFWLSYTVAYTTVQQGWEFDLSNFQFSIFWSFQSLKKIDWDEFDHIDLWKGRRDWIDHVNLWNRYVDHDRIDYIDLWKRSTLIKSIMSVFEKDRPWLNQSCQSLKISKSKWSFDHKKRLIRLREKTYFSYVLTDFTPFMPIGINLSIFQS